MTLKFIEQKITATVFLKSYQNYFYYDSRWHLCLQKGIGLIMIGDNDQLIMIGYQSRRIHVFLGGIFNRGLQVRKYSSSKGCCKRNKASVIFGLDLWVSAKGRCVLKQSKEN